MSSSSRMCPASFVEIGRSRMASAEGETMAGLGIAGWLAWLSSSESIYCEQSDNNERTKLRWIALVQGDFEDDHLYSKSLLLTELFCYSDRRVVLIHASFVT